MFGRWLGAALAVPSLVAVGLLVGSLLASGGQPRAVAVGSRAADRAGASASVAGGVSGVARVPASVVANIEGRQAVVYRAPGATRPWRRYSNPTAQHTPLVFLVRERVAGWLHVMLPSRPNGSEGWIHTAGVVLRANSYSLLVSLADHRIIVRRAGRVVLRAPVGIGRAATPTPSGLYYITELLRQPNPRGPYGPWAFALSAYSPVLTHFGAGDGQAGLHGTDEPAGIGHTVSHGCIRVGNRVIEQLAAMLPLGTPVRILARAQKFIGA